MNQSAATIRANIYIIFLCSVLAASIAVLIYGDTRIILGVTFVYLAYETSVSLLLFTLSAFGIKTILRERSRKKSNALAKKPFVSVVIAAFNESSCIKDTLHSLLAQVDVSQQIIVASDGSFDGMNEMLIRDFNLQPVDEAETHWANRIQDGDKTNTIELLTLPRSGKGFALNSGLKIVKSDVVVTLDADTKLEPNALFEMFAEFQNPKTVATGGFIYVRDAAKNRLIVRYQYVEFLRNFLWRIGLTKAKMCLQVSGAFGAFRTEILREVGGFDSNSLVEDYEIIYRLHEHLHKTKREYNITIATNAVAYTDSPKNPLAFVRQRTRWFAGFLQTLWQYRRMIFSTKFGNVGILMLPIKSIDAILPMWGFASLLILLTVIIFGRETYQIMALQVFLGKWLLDITLILIMISWHKKLFPNRKFDLKTGQMIFCIMTENFLFQPFRQIAVLNSYSWCARRVKSWNQERWLDGQDSPKKLPSSVSYSNESKN